jgi:hypothetical protein
VNQCVKNGAVVLLSEYSAVVNADIYSANGTLIFNYEPKSWRKKTMGDNPDCVVLVGNGYINKDKGIIAAPESYSCHW